jgi:GTP pyrophosphokinase
MPDKSDIKSSQELIEIIESYNDDFDRKFVQKAIDFAVEYHGSQKRASGDPYYEHPISVAKILAELKLDVGSIVTALLHDTVEDTEATIELIKEEFGSEIAYIVNGVTKLDKINFRTESEKQAENFRKFLMAISEDIRVLLVKLADRLHNMRTLHYIKKPEKRKRIAKETMDIYAPLAERIGIHKIKAELQDIAFKELNPDAYDSVLKRLEYLKNLDVDIIQRTLDSLNSNLEKAGIKAKIYGREKAPFSIWLKMQRKNIGFESVADIVAFRVIVDDVLDCYKALGVIHSNYRMVPGYFDDYVSTPKANGYQSVHTIVIGEERQRIEIQIRTKKMHEIAEYGVAAHWSYKQDVSYNMDGTQYKWVRQLLDILENATDPDEILENTKLEMYHDHVFAFTPNGDLIVLPKDGTPVDFAFAVHTGLGKTCAGAKVNGKVVPLRTKLQNGDQVEIIQSKKPTILASWQGFVKTGKARSEIRKFVRMKRQSEYADLGKSIANQIFIQNEKEFDEAKVEPLLDVFKKRNLKELYSALGSGSISKTEFSKSLFHDEAKALSRERDVEGGFVTYEKGQIPLRGLTDDISVIYASCCHPLPGENIVGIQNAKGGITIHTTHCHELESFVDDPEKWVDLRWDETASEKEYLSRLDLVVENRRGSLAQLAKSCSDSEANIYTVRIGSKGQDFCNITIDLEVRDLSHLKNVEDNLIKLDIVDSVQRSSS